MEKIQPRFSTSSGDPRLDRRYEWAAAALSEGDAATAVDLLDQTLGEAPGFVAAWHLYGKAKAKLGSKEEAAEAWRQCLVLDDADHLGARLDLARIGAIPAELAASDAFSGRLFDEYAERFDSHLVESLSYHGPALLKDALARACAAQNRALSFAMTLDLGCGTGLMGEAIRAETEFLAGCDLSARMIEKARAKSRDDGGPLYDKLAVAGLVEFLASRRDASADLVIAADVFVYLGELAPAFAQTARVLTATGLVAFTVQDHDGEDVIVGEDRRFAHGERWLRRQLSEARLTPLLLEAASTRKDRGKPVPGLVVVAARA
ncbi:methyltransferase [Bosea sp. 2YAB26]|jgi:predicted TPR repeat methyltransferase|uniref:class I SAM-dependent DNA methyltransferase n=1 Tax=unclassified Bosea (in: a-proteobacteria) TaxID=2653178 RepID=UPI003F938C4F